MSVKSPVPMPSVAAGGTYIGYEDMAKSNTGLDGNALFKQPLIQAGVRPRNFIPTYFHALIHRSAPREPAMRPCFHESTVSYVQGLGALEE